jgi:penicillin-binding protein 1B
MEETASRLSQTARFKRIAIIASSVSCVLFVAFGLYVITLLGHLKKAFLQQDQFVPTRIYSDVSRIAAPQLRFNVEERLQSLGYLNKTVGTPPYADERVTFNLHPLDYPSYLVPANHPVLDAGGQPVTLIFDGAEKDALLHSVEINGREVPDLYLEPELVATLAQNGGEGRRAIRDYYKYNDIPALVWKAIISVEDQHFMEHNGLDPRGLLRALWVDARTRSFAQGGSTITLQLIKNLQERKRKNPIKKIIEFMLAPMLEASFDKQQILERYLNEVYLGQVGSYEVRGVAEGAELFFGKKLGELNLAEIALMAGLIRGPVFYSPYKHRGRAFERQKLVLKKMVETGEIAEAEAQEALKLPVRLQPPMNYTNKAPYFADFVKAELIRQLKGRYSEKEIPEASLRVYTTLDMIANSAAHHAVEHGIADIEKRLKFSPTEKLEGALAAVDQSNGFIRALIGGRNYSQSTFNRILNMRRQIGSTFKPIVYLTAFLKGTDADGVPYAPAHPAEDSPWRLTYDHGRQEWAPHNYEKEFLGWINYRTALAHSINTVAARLGIEVGLGDVIKTARALGITSELPEVPSLSLGIAELSPVELLRAYATIADHGMQNELSVIRAITQDDTSGFWRFVNHPTQAIEAPPVDLLTDMMQSVFTEGTARAAGSMGFDHPAAGKTGTTSNHRDSWFAGYTPQLTTVVWVGMDQTPVATEDKNEKGRKADKKNKLSKINLTGATSALPIWAEFMKNALAGEAPQPFPLSPELVDVTVDRHTGKQADSSCPISQTLTDKFVKGHEPRDSSCAPDWPPSVHDTSAP